MTSRARFLCTTALEETWREDLPILFLGEWCRRFSRRSRWAHLDAEVLPYHWDDRAKLFEDYRYLQDLHERLLHGLTIKLNEIHRIDHGVRYWRILIGPWLGYFVQMLFDRWTSIRQAIERYEISGTIVLTGDENSLIPNDMEGFISLFVDDRWNHNIYSIILQQSTEVVCVKQQSHSRLPPARSPTHARGQIVRQMLVAVQARCARLLTRDQDAFLYSTYLPMLDELRLQWRLGQFPQRWSSTPITRATIRREMRDWIVCQDSSSKFERCMGRMIATQMPIVYLEGYDTLVDHAARMAWPRHPKLIWTSNAHNSDEAFKAWAASKVQAGTPIAIGQHGGHDGTGRWSFTEEHKIAISDVYLSWGWSDPKQPKVRPVGRLKATHRPRTLEKAAKNALLVTVSHPRQSYCMYSSIVSRQWLDYFEDQCAFVRSLPHAIQKALIVRLYPEDYGWDQADRWHDACPDIQLDRGTSSMMELIARSKLYISTYNATTFLESISADIPTVIYWNPRHWELRGSAMPTFSALTQVGIFHSTPISAARHVTTIWEDTEAWWSSEPVRLALSDFRARYCDDPPDLLDRIEIALRDIAVSPSGRRD